MIQTKDSNLTFRPYSMGRIIDVVQFMEHYACEAVRDGAH